MESYSLWNVSSTIDWNRAIDVQKLEDSGMHRNIIVETCVTQMSDYSGPTNYGILNHDAIQKLAKKGFKI